MADRVLPDILEIPPVPQGLKEAVNSGRLVVFLGAGVSRLAGCRGWEDLAVDLLNVCQSEGAIDYRGREAIAGVGDHRKIITICHHVLKKRGRLEVFYSTLRQALTPAGQNSGESIYDDVFKLRGQFVTTNADTLFDAKFVKSRVYWDLADIEPEKITPNALFHIHGHIDHPQSLVFTSAEYLRRYQHPSFRPFLTELFTRYTVLFIGYGMSEFEVMGTLFPANGDSPPLFPRYLLQPYFSTEVPLLGYEQSYYDDFGIEVVPYQKDRKGYHQLVDVLKFWNTEINSTTTYLNRALRKVDDALASPLEASIQDVLQLLLDDQAVQDYFFQKLAKANDALRWFPHLVDQGHFEPQRAPSPIESIDQKGSFAMPHWHALEALGHVIAQCGEAKNDELLMQARNTLHKLVVAGTAPRGPVYNIRTDWLLLQAIGRLPPELIDLSHVAFAEQALRNGSGWGLVEAEIGDALLPKALLGRRAEPIEALLRIVLAFRPPSSERHRELRPLLEPTGFVECLKKNRAGLWAWNVAEVISIVRSSMGEALAADPYAFHGMWIPAVEPHPQTMSPERYDCQMTYLLRDAILQLSVEGGKALLKEFLGSEIAIFRRVAYSVIGDRYEDWGSLFWSLSGSPLEELPYHEVYELIKKNAKTFDAHQVKRCLDWIKSLDVWVGDDGEFDEVVQEKYRAYKRREWLTALADSSDPDVAGLSGQYLALNSAAIRHPGFSSWTGGAQWVGETSPMPANEFMALTAEEAVQYINEFTPPPRSFDEPFTEVSLTGALRRFVANDPDHFLADLAPYLEGKWQYLAEFFRGFEEAARSKNLSKWPALIEFALDVVARLERSLAGSAPEPQDYRSWVVSAIADLLSTASNQERDGFPEGCVESTEQLLLALMNLPAEPFQPTHDILTSVLTSQVGRAALCAVNVSVLLAKRAHADTPRHWPVVIQQELDRRLEEAQDHAELRCVLAFSMNSVFYVDTDWATVRFPSIYDLQRPETWRMAFSSLMISTGVVYHEIYDLLQSGGHFDRALITDLVGRDVNEKFVQVVVVGFLAGWDELAHENGILRRLIQLGKPDQLTEIGRFLWSRDTIEEGTFRAKIVPLWHTLLNRTTEAPGSGAYRGVLSELGSWLQWADTIDGDVFDLMGRSIDGMETSRFPPFFVEDLAKRAELQPSEVGQLFWRFIESRPVPFYKDDVVRSIVEALFRHGVTELARRIANYYTQNGHLFLRDIVDKHEPQRDD